MKILKKTVVGSDWGMFVYRDMPEGYKAGADMQDQKNDYKKLSDKTLKQLGLLEEETLKLLPNLNQPFDPDGQILISTQLAKMLGEENGSWGNMKDFAKTKLVMKKLTEMGLKINTPQKFVGKKLVIENGVISIELPLGATAKQAAVIKNTQKDVQTVVEKKVLQRDVVDNTEKAENDIKKEIVVEEEVIQENKASVEEGVIREDKVLPKEKEAAEETKKRVEIEETTEADIPIEETIDWDETTDQILPELIEDPQLAIDMTEENLKLYTVAEKALPGLKKDAAEASKSVATLGIHRTDMIADLQDSETKFKKKTEAESWEELNNGKYVQILEENGLSNYEAVTKDAEVKNSLHVATKTVNELYDIRNTGNEIIEEDVLAKDTPFMKQYLEAEKAVGGVENKTNILNYPLFLDLKEGKEQIVLLLETRKLMKTLAEVDMPVSSDMPTINTITRNINTARERGPIESIISKDMMEEFTVKMRRTTHMKFKENTEQVYGEVVNKYDAPVDLTEKDFKKDDLVFSVATLKRNMENYEMNAAKEKNVPENKKWEGKYLPQQTSNEIQAYVDRPVQLESSAQFVSQYRALSDNFFKSRGSKDKNALTSSDLIQFKNLENKLNALADIYQEVGANVLSEDLKRIGKPSIIERLETVRSNYDKRMLIENEIKFNVKIENGVLSFPKEMDATSWKQKEVSALEKEEQAVQELILSSPEILKEGMSAGFMSDIYPYRSERNGDSVKLRVKGKTYEYSVTGAFDPVLEKVSIMGTDIPVE